MHFKRCLTTVIVSTFFLGAHGTAGFADGLVTPPVSDPVVQKECSACHMLYAPGLLPARSWSRLVDGLKDHFGENADVDAETAKIIRAYLSANAAGERGRGAAVLRDLTATAAPLRITELPWYKRKHGRDRVAPATLARKGAKFAGDCVACHRDAERGIFDD